MEVNLKLQSDQVDLILAQAEFSLMQGEMIYYGYRETLSNIFKQLPNEIAKDFHNNFPLLRKLLNIG